MEEKCIWCGKTYGEHEDKRPAGSPVPKTPCLLLKSGFVKRESVPSHHLEEMKKEFVYWFMSKGKKPMIEECADWWLEKFSSLQQKIENELQPFEGHISDYVAREAFRKKLSDVPALFKKDI